MHLTPTPDLIMAAYAQGFFPMAAQADHKIVEWVRPAMRGQLPVTGLHIPQRLMSRLKQKIFDVRVNTAFDSVIALCASATEKRPVTWINDPIRDVFSQLNILGHAHSVECWTGDNELAGGVYGLAIGQAFFAESMFFRQRDASKIALIHLAARLWRGGFTILDTQFVNPHLQQFGAYEIPHVQYQQMLDEAVYKEADFLLKDKSEGEILAAYLSFRKAVLLP